MSGNTAKKILPLKKRSFSQDGSEKNAINTLSKRQSQELLIGLCGLIGAGMNSVRTCLEKELIHLGYEIEHIHLSSLIKKYFYPNEPILRGYKRYKRYQELGNKIRENYGPQILAEAAISEIARTQKEAQIAEGKENDKNWKFQKKVAYIIDQVKNPSEVELLRMVYQHNFYYIGVIRSETERKRNLRDESIEKHEVDELIHLDRKSNGDIGQQTEKAILDADFYIRNTQSHYANLSEKIKRFISLIHGVNGITPSLNEKGMFYAFTASLQSACLSRQVGASILDKEGNIIATGRNDVPKFKGGLYSYEDKDKDYRCIYKGAKCYNDVYKNKIKESIKDVISKELNLEHQKAQKYFSEDIIQEFKAENFMMKDVDFSKYEFEISEDLIDKIVDSIYKNSRLGSLIEFSRSIHAEMDAITSLARISGENTKGKILYTTTYPCHNCARHIVASGIEKVIYIEPYEKSLALELHDDSIIDNIDDAESKLVFTTFEGVAPRRYQKFFFSTADRKKDGIAVSKVSAS
ncbi:anti-phage dCTP deaminase [Vibrio cholerae]|uniref:anti-phage dCTP deaminase n=1 Tax=Vibrio cholerae TaxID=666 RepID=UPI0028962B8E|nr:anti-phage dCTP deaminase [Vibrio cholerae]MDT3744277.1 anti-phage dCTP deaminase [Vibrio cholerae]